VSIKIPDSVTNIGEKAFDGCSSLTSINIPKNVSKLTCWFGAFKFSKNIVLPNHVTEIEEGLCKEFSLLESIEVPDGVEVIGNNAFEGCTVLSDINMPKNLKKIGYDSFKDCKFITSITLPKNVTEIGDSAFYGCLSLQSINVDEENEMFSSINGVLFNKEQTELIKFPENSPITEYTIPESVAKIADDAFDNCTSIISITIPTGVTVIGESPFTGCKSLQSIVLPNCIEAITANYFSGCNTLAAITIPESVKRIEDFAFTDCDSLKDIWIQSNTPMEIADNAFSREQKRSCTVHVPAGSISAFMNIKFRKYLKNIVEYK
jgi:hypothetical protein